MSDGLGRRAAERLASSGLCTMAPGMTSDEFDEVQNRFRFRFNDDHREMLSTGLPTGPSWPDWRAGDHTELIQHLGLPARGILRADRGGETVESSRIARAPRMIPIFGYAFTPEGPGRPGAAVWSIRAGRARRAADDLVQFVDLQLGRTVTASPPTPGDRLPFWDDYAENPEPIVHTLGDLPVPPFPPDRPPAPLAPARPPRDPGAHFAARGVELGPLTRHDDVLAHRGPLWTAAVAPERAAATWRAARAHYPETGLWPALFTDRTWHRIGDDGISDHTPVLAAELNGAAWLSEEYRRRVEAGPLPRGWEPWTPREADWESEWSLIHDVRRFTQLALVPTPAPWLVPGLLQWSGAVNYDVLGAEHASVLRRWAGRWGAELVALDDETAILRVGSPPTLDGDALQAAVEAYLYCPDSVDTGPDGVDALAPSLTGALWMFWWD